MKSILRAERERRGWTLDFVAQHVGVSGATVSRIESEGVKAAETARAISRLFGTLTLEQICAAEPMKSRSRTQPKEATTGEAA